jgi:hypothetical protein
MIVPSIRAATERGTRSLSVSRPARPRTATIAKGTRNQVGRKMVSAPIGSIAMVLVRPVEDPASSRPKTNRKIGADREQPRDQRGQLVAPHPERGAAEDHGRGRATLARHRDEPAQQGRQDDADQADHQACQVEMPNPTTKRPVAQCGHRDVRGEPRPEQVVWLSFALAVADHVDPVHLDLQRAQVRRRYRAAPSAR